MANDTEIDIGILAGGKSTRMGTDKAQILLHDERFIDILVHELSGFGDIIISAGECRDYEGAGHTTVYDENTGIGPMEGIRQILGSSRREYVFICAVDMPFIKKELVGYMAGYICPDYDCYVASHEDHIEPLCAVYKKSVLPVVNDLISRKEYRLRRIFSGIPTRYIPLESSIFDKNIVTNINTREDLAKALKTL